MAASMSASAASALSASSGRIMSRTSQKRRRRMGPPASGMVSMVPPGTRSMPCRLLKGARGQS